MFNSTNFTNDFDGILIADAAPEIYRYFLNRYRPYLITESRWFWKRSESKFTFTKNQPHFNYGKVNTALKQRIFQGDRLSLSGVATFHNQSKMLDAIYLSYGEDNQLAEVTHVDENSRWTVPIPTISLPLGKNILRLWSYDAKNSKLVQIGEDIKIDLIAQAGFYAPT